MKEKWGGGGGGGVDFGYLVKYNFVVNNLTIEHYDSYSFQALKKITTFKQKKIFQTCL